MNPKEDKSYVIVINENCEISPVRHVVTVHEPFDEDDFKKWYYSEYRELVGDKFIYCPTRADRDAFLYAIRP